ncbi:hypothetical protein [Elizabethkingia anophelis]|uniref:hypothetical protein n=1 Tax=Elizabethkingia anophelis TaxID=1117645 RepID=UPI003892A771
MALDIKSSNDEIRVEDDKIRNTINQCGSMITLTNNGMLTNTWLREKTKLIENSNYLLEILEMINKKLKEKDTRDLSAIWQQHEENKVLAMNNLTNLEQLGSFIFAGEKLKSWELAWEDISNSLRKILSIAETYKLKFDLMQKLRPEEIDALTYDILRHIPFNYSDEQAHHYEQEYLAAYKEIQLSQSKKKTLWDKVLDVLAGGIEETPAHRVQMRRWMDGNH